MTEPKWVVRWRLAPMTFKPEQVRVMPVGGDWVLMEGETHTSYKGGYFPSAEAAFKHETADIDRSLRYAQDRMERLDRAKAEFFGRDERGDMLYRQDARA